MTMRELVFWEEANMNYFGKNMVGRYEQVELFSKAEYARRLAGIRRVMREQQVEVALFLECGEETYDHWLMGRRYLDLMIVPEQGEALGVCLGELNEALCDDPEETDFGRYILQKRPDPVCDGVTIIGHLPDRALADRIAASRPQRIGLVLPVNLNASLYDEIIRVLPGVEFVDITIPVAIFRSVKSDEEMYAVRQSRNIQMKVMEALPQILRLGRTVGDMQREVSNLLTELGATGVRNGNIHYNGPMDEPLSGPMDAFGDHKLQYGDRISALFEVPGPGHQCIAFERHYSIGEPSRGYAESVENAIRVHNYAVSLMKPNSLSLAQIAVRTRKYANTLGLELRESVGWNWMHGMGAFFYDQYSLEDYTEDLPLQEGIMLHCHPLIYRSFPNVGPNAREGIHLVNTYRIGPEGAEDLVGMPKDLIVLYA